MDHANTYFYVLIPTFVPVIFFLILCFITNQLTYEKLQIAPNCQCFNQQKFNFSHSACPVQIFWDARWSGLHSQTPSTSLEQREGRLSKYPLVFLPGNDTQYYVHISMAKARHMTIFLQGGWGRRGEVEKWWTTYNCPYMQIPDWFY